MELGRIKYEMDLEVDAYGVKCEESLNEMIINRVHACEPLWNIKHKKFRDTVYKRILWSKIGNELGVNEAFLRTRWRTLRDRYLKEKKKFERATRLRESQGGPGAVQAWSLLPQLDFLRDCVQPRNKKGIPRNVGATEQELPGDEECTIEGEEEDIHDECSDFVQMNSPKDDSWALVHNVQTDHANSDIQSVSMSPTLATPGFSHCRSAEPSPEELFYMSIARTVEGLDEWTRLLIRQDVMGVVAKHIREARGRR